MNSLQSTECNDHRGRKVIYFGGAECNIIVTTLHSVPSRGSVGMLPQDGF